MFRSAGTLSGCSQDVQKLADLPSLLDRYDIDIAVALGRFDSP